MKSIAEEMREARRQAAFNRLPESVQRKILLEDKRRAAAQRTVQQPKPEPILSEDELTRRRTAAIEKSTKYKKWELGRSAASREQKRAYWRMRYRKQQEARTGLKTMTPIETKAWRIQSAKKGREVIALLRSGLDPATRITTGRKRPYHPKWGLRQPGDLPKAPAPPLCLATKASPFLAKMQKQAERAARNAPPPAAPVPAPVPPVQAPPPVPVPAVPAPQPEQPYRRRRWSHPKQ